MRNKAIRACLLMVILICSACFNFESPKKEGISISSNRAKQTNISTELLRVSTDLTEESNWWIVPENVSAMTIYAEAKNTESVLFWIAPTGTETGSERELIGYDIDGSDGWSYTWEFGSRSFHDHIHVQALGIDGSTQANMYINVHTP